MIGDARKNIVTRGRSTGRRRDQARRRSCRARAHDHRARGGRSRHAGRHSPGPAARRAGHHGRHARGRGRRAHGDGPAARRVPVEQPFVAGFRDFEPRLEWRSADGNKVDLSKLARSGPAPPEAGAPAGGARNRRSAGAGRPAPPAAFRETGHCRTVTRHGRGGRAADGRDALRAADAGGREDGAGRPGADAPAGAGDHARRIAQRRTHPRRCSSSSGGTSGGTDDHRPDRPERRDRPAVALAWSGVSWAVATVLLFVLEEADDAPWWAARRRYLLSGMHNGGPGSRTAATMDNQREEP